MTSDFVTLCDAIMSDLQTNVSGLASSSATMHDECVPWNVETLSASPGETHFAVYPLGEAEVAEAIANWVLELTMSVAVLVWQDASEEPSRGQSNRDATRTFLQLHQDVRARFLVETNESIDGSELLRYAGTAFPDVPGQVRWFLIQVTSKHPKAIA